MFTFSIPDLTKREFTILLILVIPTVFFGIYPAPILDAIHYSVSTLIYCVDFNIISCDSARAWTSYFPQNSGYYHTCFAIMLWAILIPIGIELYHFNKENIVAWRKVVVLFFFYLWYLTQFYAYCCRICILREILILITRTIVG